MINAMTQEQVKEILSAPNGADKLMASADAALSASFALFLSGDAQAAGFLCRAARRKALLDRINAWLTETREPLYAALASNEPKLRKNTARLMGELKFAGDVPALISALKVEGTRFVRPSLLLALGSIGGDEAKATLQAHTVPPAESEYDERHVRDELDALATANKSFLAQSLPAHEFTGLQTPAELELTTPELLSGSLVYELNKLNIKPLRTTASSVILMERDIARLYRCRSFFDAFIVLGRDLSPEPKSAAIKLKAPFETLLKSCHSDAGQTRFGYRIEIRGETDRASLAKTLAGYLDGDALVNAPGAYEAELRLVLKPNGSMDAYVKLFTLKDTRFSYRLGALPASIHPATASALLLHAREHLTENARVLDPCCGSGTMLIERGMITKCASLTGVDIAHKAIDVARRNAEAAGCGAKFIVNDSLRFEAARPYDELIANLPFGNRVGTHKQNEKFYAGLLALIPKWVRHGGIAVLYTMEFTLLKKLLMEHPKLKLLSQSKTNAGGLMPGIFIISVK